MAWFLNHYACPSCQHEWTDDWSSISDDCCPACGMRNISPHSSDDVSVLVEGTEFEGYRIYVSPPTAEKMPDYSLYRRASNKLELGPAAAAAIWESVTFEA